MVNNKHTEKKSYLFGGNIFAARFETTSHCFVDLVYRCVLEKATMHLIKSMKCTAHVWCPPNMAVIWVSHSCLVIELDPIYISMAAALWFKKSRGPQLT